MLDRKFFRASAPLNDVLMKLEDKGVDVSELRESLLSLSKMDLENPNLDTVVLGTVNSCNIAGIHARLRLRASPACLDSVEARTIAFALFAMTAESKGKR